MVVDLTRFEGFLKEVLLSLLGGTSASCSCSRLAVEKLFWESLSTRSDQVTIPSKPTLVECGFYAGSGSSITNVSVVDAIIPTSRSNVYISDGISPVPLLDVSMESTYNSVGIMVAR